EPSGPAESPGGPMKDADANFLAALAAMTREAGALLIYDEIMTGFRYPGGSVQRATGVIPDLTCLGKALGGGMPLSAFVGRATIAQRAWGIASRAPTSGGASSPWAGAAPGLQFYGGGRVADSVGRLGTRRGDGVKPLCGGLGGAAALFAPPFRMGLVFDEPD